jgi:hypothetical protein
MTSFFHSSMAQLFYLSQNSLKTLVEAQSLFKKTSTSDINVLQNTQHVLVVVKTFKHVTSDKERVSAISLMLFDGACLITANLNENLWQRLCCCERNHSNNSSTACQLLRPGVVLSLRKYSFRMLGNLLEQKDITECCAQVFNKQILQIDEFIPLGFMASMINLNKKQIAQLGHNLNAFDYRIFEETDIELNAKKQREVDILTVTDVALRPVPIISSNGVSNNPIQVLSERTKNSNRNQRKLNSLKNMQIKLDELECTHRLEQLRPFTTNWACKVYVTLIGEVVAFQRPNGSVGQVKRIQVRDINSQVELVVFGELCYREEIKSLEQNKPYYLRNGEVKLAQMHMRKWSYGSLSSEQRLKFNNITFDIHLNNKTVIVPISKIDNEELQYVCFDSGSCSSLANMKNASVTINRKDDESNLCLKKETKKVRWTLVDVVQQPVETTVSVLAVICENDMTNEQFIPSKHNPSYKNRVRRIRIMDTSCVKVSVALWGNDAKNFSHPVGTCIFIKDAVLSNFDGCTLNVYKKTGLMNFGDMEELSRDLEAVSTSKESCESSKDPYFQELVKWWRDIGKSKCLSF